MRRLRNFTAIWIVVVMLIFLLPLIRTVDATLGTESHTIEIATSNDNLLVEENIKIKNADNKNISSIDFWIHQDAKDIKLLAIEANKYILLDQSVSGVIYTCNLSNANISSISLNESFDIRLSYTLPLTTEYFEKTLLYNTKLLSVTFKDKDLKLYTGQLLSAGNVFQVLLYRPTEAPLNIAYILVIFILVVLLIASTFYLLRKQRSKVKSAITESEELLTTKKALLLSLLKEVEKQHRSQKISDDTYHKLKDDYKQQAVDAMKKLDNITK